MPEKSSPKDIRSAITSPVLGFLYDCEEMEQKIGMARGVDPERSSRYLAFRGQELASMQIKRQSLIAFSQREELKSINTQQDLVRKAKTMLISLAALSPEQLFDRLIELKAQSEIATDLISYGNDYIRLKTAFESGDFQGKTVDDITTEEQKRDLRTASNSREARDQELPFYYDLDIFRTSVTDDPFPLDITPVELNGKQQEAANFSRHKEAVLTDVLYLIMAQQLGDSFGNDVLTGRPVLANENVTTYEQAQRLARPLPEALSRWNENGLKTFSTPEFGGGDLYRNSKGFEQLASLVLPNGLEDSSFVQLRDTEFDTEFAFTLLREQDSGDMRQQYIDTARRFNRAQLRLQSRLFDEAIDVFSQATEPLHPEVEKKARYAAAYVISGKGSKEYDGYSIISEHKEKPLSHSVHTLRQLAYQEGVYLDPLKARMAEKLLEEGLNPNHIADLLQKALERRRQGMDGVDLLTGTTGPETWYITESLFVQSTVDQAGNYTDAVPDPERKMTGMERRQEVTEELIDYLRWLGKSN